jgi:hypothetical protein
MFGTYFGPEFGMAKELGIEIPHDRVIFVITHSANESHNFGTTPMDILELLFRTNPTHQELSMSILLYY